MLDAAFELQKAVFGELAADVALTGALGGAKLYDLAPARTAYPYVTFGPASAHDWSTDTEEGSEHFFTVNVWSNGKGRREALQLMDRIDTLLKGSSLPVAGHQLVNLRREGSEIRFDEDLIAYHGLMRFRAVIEPV
ncbi:DUF3168 domain-containing protein [Nitratireductor sp. L1-7-SE]|uniref:DUF3168 domain-containing protein n=1 Tax=Nitratireductor rhodophyticola TaxID=2854036 RepID=A0ABS7RAW1_9HYPH|nr:DUF3168 domain-containing protein [Nitratireductor rhodophyticola]MBY8918064.1 DUF3168 domain-containing protein [Nitratireductor rhodophyticola]MBY8921127.1 DUF3168 domain-containing protein [Nitratireductor rhodophyticola]